MTALLIMLKLFSFGWVLGGDFSHSMDEDLQQARVTAGRGPSNSSMIEGQTEASRNIVFGSRPRTLHLVVGVLILLGAMAMVLYVLMGAQGASHDDLQTQARELTAQIEQLRREQSMPALVLDRYRNSIGY